MTWCQHSAIKLRDEKRGRDVFLVWSTVVDAPTSYVMETEEELQAWAHEVYPNSIPGPWPIQDGARHIERNRAGPQETRLHTAQEIIERYQPPPDML